MNKYLTKEYLNSEIEFWTERAKEWKKSINRVETLYSLNVYTNDQKNSIIKAHKKSIKNCQRHISRAYGILHS